MKLKLFLVALLFVFTFSIAGSALAMTESERQALIAQIQAQIAQLTLQVNQMIVEQGGTITWCHTFNTNLGFANSGSEEVAQLHIALQREGISYGLDAINTYAEDTSTAVVQFQAKYGISRVGYVGPTTRGKLNQLYGCATTPTYTPTPTPTPTINTCQADCKTQSDGVFKISCSGIPTKCNAGQICEKTYSTSYSYSNGAVQTIETLTGSQCVTPTATTCASFTYSNWSSCSSSGTQTRTVISSAPSGCTGGNSVTSQTCTYVPPCNPSWTAGAWGACVNGQQARTVTDANNCGTTTDKPDESRSCISPTVDIKINDSDGPVTVARSSDSTINGGPFLNPVLTISYSTSGVSSCSATSNQTQGSTWTLGQGYINTVYTYTLNSAYWWSNKATNTFGITCTGLDGSTVSDSVVVNTYIPCNPSWTTGAWSACTNGTQTRTVTDANNCGTTTDKPDETQSCCAENWQCYDWSTCSYGQQQRICVDANNCGTTLSKPVTTQRCPFCTDSDNDSVYGGFYPGTTVKGTVTDYYPSQPVQYTDQCGSAGSVWENYCLNGVRKVELRGCYNTLCSNGACMLP